MIWILSIPVLVTGGFFFLGHVSRQSAPRELVSIEGPVQSLRPCPKTPNCVCSQQNPEDVENVIAPKRTSLSRQQIHERIERFVRETPGCEIALRQEAYYWITCRSSIFGFVDDLEILLSSTDARLIHFRSASRVGHSDLGANRKRIESLSNYLK